MFTLCRKKSMFMYRRVCEPIVKVILTTCVNIIATAWAYILSVTEVSLPKWFRHFCSHLHHHSFIIINSNNMQQVIIVFKGRNAILCGRNWNCANIAIKRELSKTAIFSLHNRDSRFSVNTLQWDLKQSITCVSNKNNRDHFFQHFLQDQACLHFVRAKYGQSWVSIGRGMSKVGNQ